MEATAGVEPAHSGFADRRVNHFATWPLGGRLLNLEAAVNRVDTWIGPLLSRRLVFDVCHLHGTQNHLLCD